MTVIHIQEQERLGLLFILVGPGGVGKNTLMNNVLERVGALRQLPTATTRPIRPTEKHGREHDFYTLHEFEKLIEANALVEYQEVRPGQFYGVPRKTIDESIHNGSNMIADIEVFGASILGNTYPKTTIQIFIAPTEMERLERQMRERGSDEATIRDRMKRAEMEMRYAPLADYLIVNDDLTHATEQLHRIIEVETNNQSAQVGTQVSYAVQVSPQFEKHRLVKTNTQNGLLTPLKQGQKPDEIALNTIETSLNINGKESHLSTTTDNTKHIQLNYLPHANTYEITYKYTYNLGERIEASNGWVWQ